MSLPMEPENKIKTSPGAQIGRRKLLWLAGAGAATAVAGGTVFWLKERFSPPATTGKRHPASSAGSNGAADVVIALTANADTVSLFSGDTTSVWKYTGKVLQGDPGSLQEFPDSYLGPTLRLHKGQKVRIEFTNGLPEETIIHWHGLLVPSGMDGHPRDAVAPGERFIYEFNVVNGAGTYWYHPHPHGRTGFQVNRGLAGFFLVSDEDEARLGLPTGGQDIPLVLQDRIVDDDNQFTYAARGMMEHGGGGFLGDRILVNGRPDFVLDVATRTYRLRLLNGSNARIYKLAWSNGVPLTVIGTDGGLLEAPVTRDYITLAPGERIELLADFSSYPLNTRLELQSLEFSGSSGGEMGGMGPWRQSLPDGDAFSVLMVQVVRQENDAFVVPKNLAAITMPRVEEAVNADTPRQFLLTRGHGKWLINGRSFEIDSIADDESVAFGSLEIWEFVNGGGGEGMMGGEGGMGGGGMMGGVAHPMHIHGVQFRVIGREVSPESVAPWETVRSGFVDEGWKDTVLVMPGEIVRLLLRFEKYPGLFLYHCHNLEHEDLGMIRNYRIHA